jgi:hypothetical protein
MGATEGDQVYCSLSLWERVRVRACPQCFPPIQGVVLAQDATRQGAWPDVDELIVADLRRGLDLV